MPLEAKVGLPYGKGHTIPRLLPLSGLGTFMLPKHMRQKQGHPWLVPTQDMPYLFPNPQATPPPKKEEPNGALMS